MYKDSDENWHIGGHDDAIVGQTAKNLIGDSPTAGNQGVLDMPNAIGKRRTILKSSVNEVPFP